MGLMTLEQFPPAAGLIRRGVRPAAALPLKMLDGRPDLATMPATERAAGPAVLAVVNHGRWVASCECGSAQVVTPADPRYFCPDCGNAGAEPGAWRPVAWPDQATADRVARLLAARPDPRTRNWAPPETPADLAAENAAHLGGA